MKDLEDHVDERFNEDKKWNDRETGLIESHGVGKAFGFSSEFSIFG